MPPAKTTAALKSLPPRATALAYSAEIDSPTLGNGRSGPKALSANAAAFTPGIQERAQCFPVGHIHEKPSDPKADLTLAKSVPAADWWYPSWHPACRTRRQAQVVRSVIFSRFARLRKAQLLRLDVGEF